MPSPDTKQRQFDLLYASLCEIQTGLVDNTAKVAGFLLLATGWFATSEEARRFLTSEPRARWMAIAALMAAYALYVCALFQAWRIACKTFTLLDELEFMPSKYYQQRRPNFSILIILVLGTGSLAALLVLIIALH